MSFILAWLIGVAAYVLYHHSAATLKESPSELAPPGEAILRAPPTIAQGTSSPSPPRMTGAPLSTTEPDPQRTLVGITSEQLRQIEQYLPNGAQVATYPADKNHLKTALVKADLNSDGSMESIVVHRGRPATEAEMTPQLFLSVLSREADAWKVRSSTRLTDGGVLFNIHIGELVTPLAVQDVTGDGHPEIIVASGIGASLGGVLQTYSLEGLSLHHLDDIGGDSFHIFAKGSGLPSEIKVSLRYEKDGVTYKWSGKKFERSAGGRD